MTTREVLIAARAKIADRKHWTKGELARNKKSKPVAVNDPTAYRWCSEGSIRACGGDTIVLNAFTMGAHIASAWQTNDNSKHAEVLALFDKAIEAATHEDI